MSELTVASRYAKSLIDLAQEQNALEEIKQDMTLFYNTLKANTELQAVLRNPIVPHDKKKNILKALFADKVNKTTSAFFNIMVDKRRAEILYGTSAEFISQYNLIKHIVKASVVSATPLSAANKKALVDEVTQFTGGTVEMQTKVDADLIGGFILTVGDKQVDTSVASSLRKIKKEFAQKVIQ